MSSPPKPESEPRHEQVQSIWHECAGADNAHPVRGVLHRIVESQHQIATLSLVNDLAEQAVLEELLEGSKPADIKPELHYLLSTPFRYPPLPWGSRFGRKHERGLLYGSLSIATCAAETAYYRLVLWFGMSVPPPAGNIRSEHNAFTAKYCSHRGVRLQLKPFLKHRKALRNPQNYADTQQLGSDAREAGIELMEFASARCPNVGTNVVLLTPDALKTIQPDNFTHWLCETTAERVAFKQIDASGDEYLRFATGQLSVNGLLPLPAA